MLQSGKNLIIPPFLSLVYSLIIKDFFFFARIKILFDRSNKKIWIFWGFGAIIQLSIQAALVYSDWWIVQASKSAAWRNGDNFMKELMKN